MKTKRGFFQFKISINVLVSSSRFIWTCWIRMLCVHDHYKYFFQCGDRLHTSDVRFWSIKTVLLPTAVWLSSRRYLVKNYFIHFNTTEIIWLLILVEKTHLCIYVQTYSDMNRDICVLKRQCNQRISNDLKLHVNPTALPSLYFPTYLANSFASKLPLAIYIYCSMHASEQLTSLWYSVCI